MQPDIHVVEAGYVDSEDDVPMAEKDLAEDAQWKIIQKNTFTRWVNEHLKKANTHIDDLETDFSDGLRLIALIEVLTNQKFRHINKRPTFRTQKLENVTTALNYLEEVEGLRLVSIGMFCFSMDLNMLTDSSHIVDCNLKLILGLIWTLIMHYSISLPMWDGEEERPQVRKVVSLWFCQIMFPIALGLFILDFEFVLASVYSFVYIHLNKCDAFHRVLCLFFKDKIYKSAKGNSLF